MSFSFDQTIPLLRIFDERKGREFYIDYLGFQVDWEHRFEPGHPLYMQVSRAGLTLHLTEHYGDASPGAKLLIWMQGLDHFFQELNAKEYPYSRPAIESTFYGSKCMEVIDPFGNRISFNERLPPSVRVQDRLGLP